MPVAEIREKDYDLSMNKYKEVAREAVVYDSPDEILSRIESLETRISEALAEFKEKYMK